MLKKKLSFTIFLLILFVSLVSQTAYAKEMSYEAESSQTPSPTSTESANIEYDLAFPGILPDNFLYKIKVLRDKISLALINNPDKKIEFLLLQVDKGILASAMLVDKERIELAKETALKAENNYTLLTQELSNLSKKPEDKFFKKLETASLKHQEVLSSLSKRVSKEDAKTFDTVIYFSKKNWESVKNYRDQKSSALR